jgi:hypothetical protein
MSVTIDINLHGSVTELKVLGESLMASFSETMARMTDLQASVHNINVGLDGVRSELHALRAQVAAGGIVSQSDLDNLDATIQATQSEAAEILASESAGL